MGDIKWKLRDVVGDKVLIAVAEKLWKTCRDSTVI